MILGAGVLLVLGLVAIQLPTLAAGLILHPLRRNVGVAPPEGCREVTLKGDGISLRGWQGRASGVRRGTLIYLHGVSDNRASGAGVIDRFRKRGFDVVAYDSRAHGDSGGDAATYGFFEKEDLRRVLDGIDAGPVVLIGSSLGAAVALQTAAADPRITAVVAAEVFSDLRTVVSERAPFFISAGNVGKAIQVAEQKGKFQMDAVSPELAARTIKVPVLLIHGADDTDTLPDHSRRVFAALGGPKRLILVPGAKHNQSLHGVVWEDIERWVDTVVGHSPDEQSVDPKQ
jgi:pimeloyl-ACP methyl ester carboxylesterase